MNFYECQEFFKKLYVDKNIKFEFDEKCHRVYELIYNEGKPNEYHHVESNKVKVTVDGMNSVYVPIQPHRENFSFEKMKNLINSSSL